MRITTVRQQTIAPPTAILRSPCPVCEREVEMLPSGDAMTVLGVDRGALNELIAAGQIHSVKTVSGALWICKASLFSR